MMKISPAEAAIEAAAFVVETHEMPQLVRLIARRLPADYEAVCEALCEVRRKGWISRLIDQTQREGKPWILREDAVRAAAGIHDPEADEAVRRDMLDTVVLIRLRGLATEPREALDVALGDLFDAGGRTLSAAQHAELTRTVAHAFGLPPDAPFVAAALHEEGQRRRERRAADSTARTRRREEVQRLRDWERSLVEFRDVPPLLGCTVKEALRWARTDACRSLGVSRRKAESAGNSTRVS
jgi:ATP-dependent RNA helicase SUPV3L1/SUV3